MKQVVRFIWLIAALVLTLSCDHKELLYDVDWTVALNVNFDWSKAPTANPEGMSVYMFDLDKPGTRPERYDLIGKNGGRIKIVPGNYSFVCINNDVENILFRNDRSFDDYSIYTRNITMESGMNINSRFSTLTRAELPSADDKFIMSPDSCWTATVRNVEVVKDEPDRSITFVPEISVVTIDVIITDALNIRYSTEFGGTLDNMCRNYTGLLFVPHLFRRRIHPDIQFHRVRLRSRDHAFTLADGIRQTARRQGMEQEVRCYGPDSQCS